MPLGGWLTEKQMTFGQFGARIGTSAEAVRRYVLGLRIPRPIIMRRIVSETGGAVTEADFYATPSVGADEAA